MSNKIKVDIYTRPGCGYCDMAKKLLSGKNVDYNEITVDGTSVTKNTIQNRLSTLGISDIVRTVPQIIAFKNNEQIYVGGFDNLVVKLNDLLV